MKSIARRPGLLVLAALALAAAHVQPQDPPPARPLRIAIVDPAQVMRESKWAQRLKETFNAEFEALRREQAELEATIQRQIKDAKETWKAGTREYDMAVRDISIKRQLQEENDKMYQAWLNRAQVEFELTVLQEIEREVQALATNPKWQLDLVLRRKNEVPRDQERNLDRLKAMLDNQVVFAAKDLDITKTIVSLLDNRKNASGAPVEASGNGSGKGEPAPANVQPGKEGSVPKEGSTGAGKESGKR